MAATTHQTTRAKQQELVKAVVLHTEFTDRRTGVTGILGDEIEVDTDTFDEHSKLGKTQRSRRTDEIISGPDDAVDLPALAKPGSDLAKRAIRAEAAGLVSTPHPSFRAFE